MSGFKKGDVVFVKGTNDRVKIVVLTERDTPFGGVLTDIKCEFLARPGVVKRIAVADLERR